MGTAYSAKLIVGLPQQAFVEERVEKRSKPQFDPNTGARLEDVPDDLYRFYIGGKEVESVFETLFENDLSMARVANFEETVWGVMVAGTPDHWDRDDMAFATVDVDEILKAQAEANLIFQELGVTVLPKVYLVLCGE